jgi:hypothetical protein
MAARRRLSAAAAVATATSSAALEMIVCDRRLAMSIPLRIAGFYPSRRECGMGEIRH